MAQQNIQVLSSIFKIPDYVTFCYFQTLEYEAVSRRLFCYEQMKKCYLLIAPQSVLRAEGTCMGLKLIQCRLVAPPTVFMRNFYKIAVILTRNTQVQKNSLLAVKYV